MKRSAVILASLCLLLVGSVSLVQSIEVGKARLRVKTGVVKVRGKEAQPGATIFWQGQEVTRAGSKGNFRFLSSLVPQDCIGRLRAGVDIVLVTIRNCRPDPNFVRLSHTGQTSCFDIDGEEIPCLGTGQDGELQSGVKAPAERFTDNHNGTVTDNHTGRTWTKDVGCMAENTWSATMEGAGKVADGVCGLTDGSSPGDWVVPNIRELLSLVHYGSGDPALSPGHPFAGVDASTLLWSSTTFINERSKAMIMPLADGLPAALSKDLPAGCALICANCLKSA